MYILFGGDKHLGSNFIV